MAGYFESGVDNQILYKSVVVDFPDEIPQAILAKLNPTAQTARA